MCIRDRYSAKQMNAAAWDIYTSIIAAENIDDVRALFVDNRDVKNMLMGRFRVEVINEEVYGIPIDDRILSKIKLPREDKKYKYISDNKNILLKSQKVSKLFEISSPIKPSYKTYFN